MYARAITSGIDVLVQPSFIGERPSETGTIYLHRYEVLIRNTTDRDVQLLARRWHITDLCQPDQLVQGRGVIGAEPVIAANSSYHYASGAALKSLVGAMQGMYWMADLERGERFWVAIPKFQLEAPWIRN